MSFSREVVRIVNVDYFFCCADTNPALPRPAPIVIVDQICFFNGRWLWFPLILLFVDKQSRSTY
ncbi:hypothetical protein MANES_13G028701v8 [Manihot esculenta]|uniref:Uncharacterized protein n=1 Tax=Manihot esculenta TaxID=3983 RepID=A0ACB7GJR2_MANES|nr:hypothetical protein MANES_13G028701v8 [Manihot esculenta]